MSEEVTQPNEQIERNPSVFGLLLFGFSLVAVGTYNFLGGGEGALVFSTFIAGLGELLAGIWVIIQGRNHLGNVMATFGIWLLGLFLLEVVGGEIGLANPLSISVYFLAILIPVILLYVPVYKNSLPWSVHLTFAALFLLPLFTGASFLIDAPILIWLSGLSAYVGAFGIWLLAYEEIEESMVESSQATTASGSKSRPNPDD